MGLPTTKFSSAQYLQYTTDNIKCYCIKEYNIVGYAAV